MKKFFIIMCVALTTLCSCSKEDSTFKSPLESFKINDMNVSYIGADYSINLPVGSTYNIGYDNNNFVNAYIFDNKLNVIVLPNFSSVSRKCSIVIIDTQNDNYAIKFNINQESGSYFNINPTSFDCDYNEQEYTINLDTNVDYNVSTTNNWIHIKSRDNNKVTFTVDKNDNDKRTGEIIFSYYFIHGTPKDTHVVINQNKNPNKQDVPNTNEEKEDIICGYSWSGINVGGYIQGIYSVSCTNKMKNDIEIISFELYKNDTLNSKADDLPKIVKPGESISYSFNYKGYGDSLYVIWKIKSNGENIEKRVNLN